MINPATKTVAHGITRVTSFRANYPATITNNPLARAVGFFVVGFFVIVRCWVFSIQKYPTRDVT